MFLNIALLPKSSGANASALDSGQIANSSSNFIINTMIATAVNLYLEGVVTLLKVPGPVPLPLVMLVLMRELTA